MPIGRSILKPSPYFTPINRPYSNARPSKKSINSLKEKYTKGGFGYGHAKTELLNYILSNFSSEREKFDYYMSNKEELEAVLKIGSEKADKVAQKVLSRVREKLGYN